MDEFPFIEVSGSAFQMGFQHGRQAEPLIRKYLEWIEKLTGIERERLRSNALRFLPHIRKLSPQYVEEIFGLAEGARLEIADAVLCQARAEAAHRWDSACTAFALTGRATTDGLPLAGQNQDLEPAYADMAIVLRVRPGDGRPAAVMFTFAGQLGYAGMNQFGVCNFVNALYHFDWKPGLPFYPLRRVLLEQRSVDACVLVLRRHPACSAANLVIADGNGRIADLECRPEGVAVYPDHDRDARLHTNHYVTREFAHHEDGRLPDSAPRLKRVQDLVRNSWGKITVEAMKEMLADHEGGSCAICRHGGVGMHSIAGYIAEPARGVLHIRRGHGCDGAWKSYRV